MKQQKYFLLLIILQLLNLIKLVQLKATNPVKNQYYGKRLQVHIHRVLNTNETELVFDSTKHKGSDYNITLNLTTTITCNNNQQENDLKFNYELTCLANDFPVEWIYNGFGVPHVQIRNYRHSNITTDGKSAMMFTTKVSFYRTPGEESNSGNYLCRSKTNHSISISLDVYLAGDSVFMLDAIVETMRSMFLPINDYEFDQSTETVGLRSSDSDNVRDLTLMQKDCKVILVKVEIGFNETWANLPCSVSRSLFHPRSNILLYQVNVINNDWIYFPLNKANLTYNPMTGFNLNIQNLTSNSSHWKNFYFICASNRVKTLVNITIVPSSLQHRQIKNSHKKYVDFVIPDLYFNQTTEEFVCKWPKEGSTPAASVGLIPCYSISHCQFTKSGLENAYKVLGQLRPSLKKGQQSLQEVDATEIQSNFYNLTRNPIDYIAMSSGLFYCVLLNEPKPFVNTIAFYKLQKGVYIVTLDSSSIMQIPPTHEILQIQRIQEELADAVKNSTTIMAKFKCFGSSLFLAEPFVWKLLYSNGSKFIQPGSNKEHYKKMSTNANNGILSSRLELELYISSVYAISIECHAPIWEAKTAATNYTAQWVYLDYNLTFHEKMINNNILKNPEKERLSSWLIYALFIGISIIYMSLIIVYAIV